MAEHDGWRARWRVWRGVLGVWLAVCGAWVHAAGPDITRGAQYWIDGSARSDVSAVASLPPRMFAPLAPGQTFSLDDAALWVRLEVPPLDGGRRWYLQVDFNALDRVELYQQQADGTWSQQQAGDRLPLSQWSLRDRLPVFRVDAAGQPRTVWLRMTNQPVPVSPELTLLDEDSRDAWRVRTFVALGAYFGFGALVLFIGLIHARLYADRAFVAYGVYVANMLALQVSFTGLGGLLLWPEWPAGNNGSPALFTLWLTASSIWFLREVCAVSRFHRGFDRLLGLWSLFGWLYPVVYIALLNRPALVTLHAYVFLSGLLGLVVCAWAWRQGERYAGWVGLGLLPVVLTFPFPALRNLGVLPANALTQYALVLGSFVEIPLLLYILYRRARDYSENRVRLRSIDSTDPLTGLVASPVLGLRLRDALRRSRRYGHRCGVALVELANHADFLAAGGRELGERALVVAASRLSRVVRDVDTVSRVSELCFAIHVEGPAEAASLADLATHVVAKGLARTPLLPPDLSLRLRVVTLLVPDPALAGLDGEEGDDERCLAVLRKGLERMAADDRRMIRHLGRPEPAV